MIWVLAAVALAAVVVIALVAVGRETSILSTTARPAVFEVEEAVAFIAERVPHEVAGRISHDDVRWILQADVGLLEAATADAGAGPMEIVDEDSAVAIIIGLADDDDRDLADADVVAVLDARMQYLRAIGAIGPEVAAPPDLDG